jgi:hypothetical protein
MVCRRKRESSPFITGYFYDFSLLEVKVRGHLGLKPHLGLVPDDATADLHPRSLDFNSVPSVRRPATQQPESLTFSFFLSVFGDDIDG